MAKQTTATDLYQWLPFEPVTLHAGAPTGRLLAAVMKERR